jgi:hypothetical protein
LSSLSIFPRLTIAYRTDPAAIAAYLPEPLAPGTEPDLASGADISAAPHAALLQRNVRQPASALARELSMI